MIDIDIAFSPCPNDTFIFHALVEGRIDTGNFRFHPVLADVETLNRQAMEGRYGLTKLSFAALMQLEHRYRLLDAGAALGFGCGPLVVTRNPTLDITQARIAIPGRLTTACLLLRLWQPTARDSHLVETPFDAILPGVASGSFDAGVVIHEGRFVVDRYDCTTLIDLGDWWEQMTSCPIPLGCIAARNDLADHTEAIEALIRASLKHARNHPEASRAFIRRHAQEMADDIIEQHIALYVNDFSVSLGEAGRKAVDVLRDRWKRLMDCPT
ncbi:MAG: 1,4-dihydroxy-6-naphthoate synthase [Thermodesulfobacteriota bacterium]